MMVNFSDYVGLNNMLRKVCGDIWEKDNLLQIDYVYIYIVSEKDPKPQSNMFVLNTSWITQVIDFFNELY